MLDGIIESLEKTNTLKYFWLYICYVYRNIYYLLHQKKKIKIFP